MGRLTNISDQLGLFANEVATIIRTVQHDYDMSFEQASTCVDLAIKDMALDVQHHAVEEGVTVHSEVDIQRARVEHSFDSYGLTINTDND